MVERIDSRTNGDLSRNFWIRRWAAHERGGCRQVALDGISRDSLPAIAPFLGKLHRGAIATRHVMLPKLWTALSDKTGGEEIRGNHPGHTTRAGGFTLMYVGTLSFYVFILS